MMRYGIPRYRLPREILDAEVARIVGLGVTLELGAKVTDVLGAMHDEGFDAVFLAVGAHIGKRAYVPAGEAARILDAVTVLHSMEGEEQPLLGRRVAVYGGGNTAMDVARTATAARRDRGRRRLPPHARPDARARLRGRGGRGRGRADEVALDRQAGRGRCAHDRADGARRERVPAADRRARGARGRRARAGARPGVRPRAPRRRAGHRRSTTESCRSARTS